MTDLPAGGKKRGRKKHFPPLKKRLVSLTEEQAMLLRKWGRGDLSAGLRWLVDAAALLVRKAGEDQPGDPRSSG